MVSFPQLDAFRRTKRGPRLIGHRGARGVMPENSMEGFAFTLNAGVRALEFDVVLTKDNVPVITHNHCLANSATRDAAGNWLKGPERRVSAFTYAELQAFDIGGLDGRTVYGQRFPDQVFLSGVKLPRLADLLCLANEPANADLHLLLEIKSDSDQLGDAAARFNLVKTVIDEVFEHGLKPRTVMHSFDWGLLDECRRYAPDMPTSYLSQLPENDDEPGEDSSQAVGPNFAKLTKSVPAAIAEAGGQFWCPYFQDVTRDLVREAQDLGLIVLAWTANEPDEIKDMIAAGVDGFVTDYPGRAQRLLLDQGLLWHD